MIGSIPGEGEAIRFSVSFSPDEKSVTASANDAVKIWDAASGKELLSLRTFDETDWLVSSPEGRIDLSPGAEKYVTWRRQGKVHGFQEMKARYHVPGLWQQVLGGSG